MDILEGLNDAQKTAVQTTTGPVLLLAGAGSGKTKTLTHRIAHLIASQHIWPNEILAVTFTNKAAREMRTRLSTLLGQPDTRSFMPWMGTFHGICVKLLRIHGHHLDIASNFVIYDEDDRQSLIKQAMKTLAIADKQIKPRAVSSAISNAKNELQSPSDMAANASYPFEKSVAKIYATYETLRRQAGALDFDDLLIETVRLLREHPEVRDQLRSQFRHILIDEYQDTNAAQYAIVKSLVNDEHNICVVGDDWQCFPAGTPVMTPAGERPIEMINGGDTVIVASGFGTTSTMHVTRRRQFEYNGELVVVTTQSGRTLRVTPNHLMFARLESTDRYFVYLMYASRYGYRIGMARGTRFDGRRHDVGLRVRANQERAEKMWILASCATRGEAQYTESLYSYKYGIPMMVFRADINRSMSITQAHIDTLYQAIDTRDRAATIMRELGLHPDYPHFIPQATTRGDTQSVRCNIVLFGDRRRTDRSPWSASRLSVYTTNPSLLNTLQQRGFVVRASGRGSYRVEAHNLDYGVIERLAATLADAAPIQHSAFLTSDKKFHFTPAGQLHPDMAVAVIDGRHVVADRIVSVSRQAYRGMVYDLDIDQVHNYCANGVVVHNSIYSWRGADFRNILRFEQDFPGTVVIKLEQNYRSTGAILEAAHNVITKNVERTDKQLWTAAGTGAPVQIQAARDEAEEAFNIASRIATQVQMAARRYRDVAVLYRMNSQSAPLERAMMQLRVPYQIVGGVRFYDRREVKDIIAYLRLLYQPADRISFTRIVNVPTRGIGATSLERFLIWQANSGMDIIEALVNADQASSLTPRAKKALVALGELLRTLQLAVTRDTPPAELIEQLVASIGYEAYLRDGTPQAEDRIENLGALVSDARTFAALPDFLEEVALMSSVDSATDHDSVTLMTIHAAKGLEFPVVFMVGMEEGIFPHSRVYQAGPSELEEERRLCYVGMTRARQELHMSFAACRLQFGQREYNSPSRFLADMGYEAAAMPVFEQSHDDFYADMIPDFDIGDRVRSAQFGTGEIVDVDGLAVSVSFDSGTIKKLNIEFAHLEKL